jgi:hypothetical protein
VLVLSRPTAWSAAFESQNASKILGSLAQERYRLFQVDADTAEEDMTGAGVLLVGAGGRVERDQRHVDALGPR